MHKFYDPEYREPNKFWYCNVCDAQNSIIDGECQYCECQGLECKRDNCSCPEHFHQDHIDENEPVPECKLCQLKKGE
jgi:hypothetical protein